MKSQVAVDDFKEPTAWKVSLENMNPSTEATDPSKNKPPNQPAVEPMGTMVAMEILRLEVIARDKGWITSTDVFGGFA